MERKAAIVGWAQSPIVERDERIHKTEMIGRTVQAALDKSGLSIGDIDTVISASCDTMDGASISNVFVVESMGGFMKEESKVEEDGAYAALYAYLRLLTGHHKTALIVAHGRVDTPPQFYSWMMTDPFLLRPLGVEMVSAFALQARSYLSRYNLDERPAAKVVVKNRANGVRNPNTQVRIPISEAEVLKSPVLASPIKLADASPRSEAACALILANGDLARKITPDPVWIEGVGYNHDLYYLGHRDLARPESLARAAKMAYAQAGIRNPRKETDFAEVYEPFSFSELMICEGLGLAEAGEGRKLVEKGIANLDGAYPVNASGGALCGNPIFVAGLLRMVEAARQLTGNAGEYQIKKDIRRGLVHATSGFCLQSNIVYVLGRDEAKPKPIQAKKQVKAKVKKTRKAVKKAVSRKPVRKKKAGRK